MGGNAPTAHYRYPKNGYYRNPLRRQSAPSVLHTSPTKRQKVGGIRPKVVFRKVGGIRPGLRKSGGHLPRGASAPGGNRPKVVFSKVGRYSTISLLYGEDIPLFPVFGEGECQKGFTSFRRARYCIISRAS